jgi:hypothetical protein
MARRYARDRRGRFSSTGATARGGRLTSMAGKRYATQTRRVAGGAPAGTISKAKRLKPSTAPASNIRPTGGLQRIKPANAIKRTRSERRGPLVVKANAIRTFNPKTPGAQLGQLERKVERRIKDFDKEIKSTSKKFKEVKPEIQKAGNRLERMNAQAMQNRFSKNKTDQFLSKVEIGTIGTRAGQKAIRRRMERASTAAERGSKPAARARQIYANQMAFMGSGKVKAAKSNIRPGPRNTQPQPKRKPRKPRKPKS